VVAEKMTLDSIQNNSQSYPNNDKQIYPSILVASCHEDVWERGGKVPMNP
jgi:hypothetical protein